MRAVAQRVKSARVEVEGEVTGAIDHGLLVYLGVQAGDTDDDFEYMRAKVAGLRIFEDETGRMARSVGEAGGGVLVVSQFTLFGDVRRGRRPSFDGAAPPDVAEATYERFLRALESDGLRVASGRFRADMRVHSIGDGPVTILLDSRRLF